MTAMRIKTMLWILAGIGIYQLPTPGFTAQERVLLGQIDPWVVATATGYGGMAYELVKEAAFRAGFHGQLEVLPWPRAMALSVQGTTTVMGWVGRDIQYRIGTNASGGCNHRRSQPYRR